MNRPMTHPDAAIARAAPWRMLLWPGLATLAALAILLSLGTWQMQRLAWKDELIARIAARAQAPATDELPLAGQGMWQGQFDPAEHEYRRVRVAGTFEHGQEVRVHGLMSSRTAGQPLSGYYVLTPLRLADGRHIIVNRGFVPTQLADPASRAQAQAAGPVEITGLVRGPEPRNWFTPADNPARNEWYSRDPQAIAAALRLTQAAPWILDADATPNPGGWPLGGQTRMELPNNHLQYALTWYGIALTLLGVFAAFAVQRLRLVR
jgi:surfeit locus 1 family protein